MTNADNDYNYRIVQVSGDGTEGRKLWEHSPVAMVLRFELHATFMAVYTLEAEQYHVGIITSDPPAIRWIQIPNISVCELVFFFFFSLLLHDILLCSPIAPCMESGKHKSTSIIHIVTGAPTTQSSAF